MTRYLSAANVDDLGTLDVEEYPLPYDPETLVRIRAVSLSRIKQYHEAQAKGGAIARRAEAEIISESVIDEQGQPVWTTAESVERIGQKKTRLMVAIVKMIGRHNGGDDKLAEEAEKNSDETN